MPSNPADIYSNLYYAVSADAGGFRYGGAGADKRRI